jgi:predicted phage terminase large subunit-like protein
MSTRGNDPKTGAKVIVMQRVRENDLSGHVLKQGGYEHLCLPAEFEPSRKCVTVIGWEDPRKAEGELLWPERVGPREIAEFKVRLGPNGYAGQFQQTPVPAGGGRFKEAWLRRFKRDGDFYRLFQPDGSVKVVKVEDCDRFSMMDPAGTDKMQNEKACYTVIGAYDVTPDGEALRIDHYREQVEAPAAADAAVGFVRRNDCEWIGIERDGMGLGVVQTVRRRGVTVRPIKAKGSKEARSETAEIRMAAGLVYVPDGAPWVYDWIAELTRFPFGEYADQVDEFAHAMRWVGRSKGPPAGEGDASPSPVSADLEEQEAALAAIATGTDEDDAHWHEIG